MNIQKVANRTAEILNLYYNNEIEPFLNSCHDDVLWIGPAEKQVIRGRKNLMDAFHAEEHELKFSLNNLTLVPLATTSSTVAEVMTFMLVDTIWPDNSVSRVKSPTNCHTSCRKPISNTL